MEIFSQLEELLSGQNKHSTDSKSLIAHLGTPCVSVGILENDEIHWASMGPQPCVKDTIFQACSISKAITSLGVVKLVQEGKLDLDASISTYLSEDDLSLISTPETGHLVTLITLRHLLTHTSGLSVGGFGGYPSNPPTVPQILGGLAPANNLHVHLVDLPGRAFSYSGGGFTVVQLILTTVFNKRFEDLLKEVVLNPLGMTRSFYGILPENEKNFAPTYYTAEATAPFPYHILPELAAAGLWTTPTDLLKAIAAIQSSLKVDGFLTQKWAKQLLTADSNSGGYGLGWALEKDGMSWGHGGSNDPGYRCHILGYKESGNGICVMTNSKEGVATYGKIIWAVAYLKHWPFTLTYNSYISAPPLFDKLALAGAKWMGWKGKWGDWEIFGDKTPQAKWKRLPAMELLVAARPPQAGEIESFEFVVEGLNIVVKLSWNGEKRIVVIIKDGISDELDELVELDAAGN